MKTVTREGLLTVSHFLATLQWIGIIDIELEWTTFRSFYKASISGERA